MADLLSKRKTGAKATTNVVLDDFQKQIKKEIKGKETKTARPQLIIEPSAWEDFKLIASMQRKKTNQLFCELVYACIQENGKTLDQYKKFLKELGKC